MPLTTGVQNIYILQIITYIHCFFHSLDIKIMVTKIYDLKYRYKESPQKLKNNKTKKKKIIKIADEHHNK